MKYKQLSVVLGLCLWFGSATAASAAPDWSRDSGKLGQNALAQMKAMEYEVNLIRQRVLRKCGLAADVAPDKLPWYFHYEFALELLDAGHAQQALTVLYRSTAKRTIPKRGARMYGMWFVDYLPYYQIAATHAQLGNWTCARQALEKAEHFGVFNVEHADFDDYRKLRTLIHSRTAVYGSALSFHPQQSYAACA